MTAVRLGPPEETEMKLVGLKCCVLGCLVVLIAGCPNVVTTPETNKEACVSGGTRVFECSFSVASDTFPDLTQDELDDLLQEQLDLVESLCALVPETATDDCNWHRVRECFASHSCTELVEQLGTICAEFSDDVDGCPTPSFDDDDLGKKK